MALTREQQQLLEVLSADRIVQSDQLNSKRAMIEDVARQKGIARSLVEILGISEEDVVNAIVKATGVARMKIATEMDAAPSNILTEDEILRYRALPVFL
ncbi:MAG TPA: hypothetical protein DEP53_10720, partial [Bacteroidetes bacterium]|nr:hypothetical protein [Bacteroidota bacterium]